jgi:sporulation protein YlmC with PRC-barrel domain
MEDLGAPIAYLALEKGAPVYSSDGTRVGRVEHVLADADADIFEGIVIDESVLPGGHRFADEEVIGEIHERGVVLTVDAAAAEALPKPSEAPAAVDVGPDDLVPDTARDRLRKAWDYISGNY